MAIYNMLFRVLPCCASEQINWSHTPLFDRRVFVLGKKFKIVCQHERFEIWRRKKKTLKNWCAHSRCICIYKSWQMKRALINVQTDPATYMCFFIWTLEYESSRNGYNAICFQYVCMSECVHICECVLLQIFV